ncbi:hypothetical protein MVEN_01831600 [Mycena venus]|uniref:DUF4100 domain-containing protein n=1 Tax=Mycena venus TaxID=2733690 RepID=A0A8H6XLE9_9AGAR|nr:hypothetical protein MVEN_01831600 [Mycena venus]
MHHSSIPRSLEKKEHATRFLTVEDQDVWETLDEFSNATRTYADFKAAILKLYPGTDADRKYSLSDLDALVGKSAREGIHSKADFSEFYRQFIVISKYLVSKGRLSDDERSRTFRRAIQPPSLWDKVHQRLQIKKPDVHPEDPYAIDDMYEAINFALADRSPAPSTDQSTKVEAKQETLLEAVHDLLKLVADRYSQPQPFNNAAVQPQYNPTRPDGCAYCSDLSHFIGRCPHVQEDIDAGKCRRDADGKVVLPTGSFVPRRINGVNLRARIEEWHRQNPGQMASPQLLFDITPTHRVAVESYTAQSQPSFSLSVEDRIESLQREIFALRTRAQARAAAAAGEPVEQPEQPIRPTPPKPQQPEPIPQLPPPVCLVPRVEPDKPGPVRDLPPHMPPEHPFARARDAAYAPPRDRNVGVAPPQQKKPDPAYRTTAPIYDEKIATAVFDRSMDVPITITQRELLSISPEVRSQVRDVTTSRRVTPPAKDKFKAAPAMNYFAESFAEVFPYAAESDIVEDTFEEQQAKDDDMTAFLDSMPAAYSNAVKSEWQVPPGAFIVDDPYEAYYALGKMPDDLIVSMESTAIRSILLVIDNKQMVECIVDPGSQIIAMSEAVCHDLGLMYDPRIILQMQSANGSVSPSLGLARNVPFLIGNITLYLQVHVVRNPAYDVLLGRPFDVLTQSIVHNFANENQTITICDPNTGQVSTVPTVPRGPPRVRQQGFQMPRN